MWIDDIVLAEYERSFFSNIFVPDEVMVVLGRGNKAEVECDVLNCLSDRVDIKKRYGGGGTVVLHPGCLVVSTGVWVDSYFKNDFFFKKINESVIQAIQTSSPDIPNIDQRGISDLAIDDKKIAGTSLFRSKNYLLYQASILVDSRINLISKYLKHPSKEPDYRKGKSHDLFLTDLKYFDNSLTSNAIKNHFEDVYEKFLLEALGSHIIDPKSDHFKHLRARIDKSRAT